MRTYANPNPQVSVLLKYGNASARLRHVLWPFHRHSLKWLDKHWPEEKLRRSLAGYGPLCSQEWNAIRGLRIHRHFEIKTQCGNRAIIYGDPLMPKATREALAKMLDAAAAAANAGLLNARK